MKIIMYFQNYFSSLELQINLLQHMLRERWYMLNS